MTRYLLAAAFATSLLVAAVPGRCQEREAQPKAGFSDVVTVALETISARIVDAEGYPIRDLKPRDLLVKVGKKEIPVLAVDWQSAGPSAPIDPVTTARRVAHVSTLPREGANAGVSAQLSQAAASTEPQLEESQRVGDLVVIFMQIGHHMAVKLDPAVIGGHLKILPFLRRLLRGLDPEDQVAVFSFDARLKLWQDFSDDREATADVLFQTIGYRVPPPPQRGTVISLLDHFDEEAARRASNPEVALKIIGESLEPLPGDKQMLYVGWGLGRLIFGVGVMMPRVYYDALDVLEAASTTVSVIDVTQADAHSLSVGLRRVSRDTGGVYITTFDYASRKIRQFGQTFAGFYLLTIDRGSLPEGRQKVTVELRGRKGEVYLGDLN